LTYFAEYTNVSVSSWHSFIFTAQEVPTIYLIKNNAPVFQVLTFTAKAAVKTLYSIRITCDMTEAVYLLE